jgi:hypothetical protein
MWFAPKNAPNWAITLGQTAYYSMSEKEVLARPNWIKHENKHKEQCKRLGTIKYLILNIYYNRIKYGYENNPLEIEAREAETNE